MHSLLDAIVDSCFPILEFYGDRLEDVEAEVLQRPTPAAIREIHALKRELLLLRRAVWPMREVISSLQREPHDCMSDQTRTYMRDVYDHTVQIIDIVETYREIATGLTETYMSAMSQRLNEVMKVLTIIGTIFIPLTFLAGVYGMNFKHFPEIEWVVGLPVLLGRLRRHGGGDVRVVQEEAVAVGRLAACDLRLRRCIRPCRAGENEDVRRPRSFELSALVLAAWLIAVVVAAAQAAPPADIDAFVGAAMKAFDVPGLALAIVKDGKVVYAKGYGVRRIDDPAPVTTKTLFGIASNTKAFTAAAVAILVDEGKVDWDGPVAGTCRPSASPTRTSAAS